jgi:flagellar biosynthesis protein FlhA
MGFIVPPIRIRDNIQLDANEYVIKIRGVDIAKGSAYPGQFLAMNPGTAMEKLDGLETIEPAFGLPAYWIDETQREQAEVDGFTVVEATAVVATHLMEIIKSNADKILGRQETQSLLNNLKESYPAVVEEVTPGVLSVGAIQHVLQNLLRERIPVRDLVTILETLADYGSMTRDTDVLTEYVRQSLATTITKMYQNEQGVITALTLDPKIERMIEEGVRGASQAGASYSMPPEALTKLYHSLSKYVESMISNGQTPLIIVSPTIRMHFRRVTVSAFPNLIVLSYNELTPTVQVESAGGVRIENEN